MNRKDLIRRMRELEAEGQTEQADRLYRLLLSKKPPRPQNAEEAISSIVD